MGIGTPGDLRRFAGQKLTIAYISAEVAADLHDGAGRPFEATTGATLEWLVAPVDQTVPMLLGAPSNKPPFDGIITHRANTVSAIERGLISAIDYQNIPNSADVLPAARTIYAAGLWYFVAGFCYRTDIFQENDVPAPTGTDSLFDPALSGRIAVPASTASAPIDNLIPLLSRHFAMPLADPGPLMAKLGKLVPCGFIENVADSNRMLTSGEAWVAYHTYGDCMRLREQGTAVDMAPYNLRVGGSTYRHWGVLTGLQCTTYGNRELCEIFADFLLAPSGAGILPARRKLPFPVTIPAAQKALLADPRTAAKVYPNTDWLYEPPLSVEALYHQHRAEWLAAWKRAFA